jgi:hypothetical protein
LLQKQHPSHPPSKNNPYKVKSLTMRTLMQNSSLMKNYYEDVTVKIGTLHLKIQVSIFFHHYTQHNNINWKKISIYLPKNVYFLTLCWVLHCWCLLRIVVLGVFLLRNTQHTTMPTIVMLSCCCAWCLYTKYCCARCLYWKSLSIP